MVKKAIKKRRKIMESIFERRSVRSYLEKAVEPEKIDKILRAGMQAPSARNQQPWEFLVIEDRETLMELSKVHPYAICLEKAPLAIIVLKNEEGLVIPEKANQDLSACTQNILLEAVHLELGAVWLGIAPTEERMEFIKDMFNLPKNISAFSIVSIGYPKREGANKFVDRYVSEKVHYGKY